jgi:2-polyprenyl-3-methyl-5-hydroxy-6-metoxy-1,4-benzoquinol methylase
MNHVVIIPTHGRSGLLNRAISSVISQALPPDLIMVIYERDNDLKNVNLITDVNQTVKITKIKNEHAHNISGAINEGVYSLISSEFDPDKTILSFLDDDDTWEPEYIQMVRAMMEKGKLDLVYSGIIRHERSDGEGIRLRIPEEIRVKDFQIGNPHIQMSNLSIRLSSFLKAGAMDENMESTVDRDLIIRILELGYVKTGRLNEHLVHHNALDHERLSTPGNPRKMKGLNAFYQKRAPLMSKEERELFKKRSLEVFGCEIREDDKTVPDEIETVYPSISEDTQSKINLVVGFTAGDIEDAISLIEDIDHYSKELKSRTLAVICDNTGSTIKLEDAINKMNLDHVKIRVIGRERINKDSKDGKFGEFYVNESRQAGVPFGRTSLHYYLYTESIDIFKPVFWILDGDVRLYDEKTGRPLNSVNSFLRGIKEMKQNKLPFSIGNISGAPPIPPESMYRTGLLDLFYHIKSSMAKTSKMNDSWFINSGNQARNSNRDYYYDNSILSHNHLESPVWEKDSLDISGNNMKEALENLQGILRGEAFSRHILPDRNNGTIELSRFSIPRGGNTVVISRQFLRLYPNMAPFLRGRPLRRGDSLWEIISLFSPEYLEFNNSGKVGSVNLTVMQSRKKNPHKPSVTNLMSDIFGSSFSRALETYLSNRTSVISNSSRTDDCSWLLFSSEDVRNIIDEFERNLKKRLPVIITNIWRIIGLIGAINNLLPLEEGNTMVEKMKQELLQLEKVFNRGAIDEVQKMAGNYGRSDLQDYLYNMQNYVLSYRNNIPYIPEDSDISEITGDILEHFRLEKLKVAGSGREGIVFTDGKKAYKWFYRRSKHLGELSIETAVKFMQEHAELKYINRTAEIHEIKDHIVSISDYVKGIPYEGGHFDQITGLLRECRELGIVITNMSPENLIISDSGLKYVDFGRSIESFSEEKFINMCKRAYIISRFSFRPDIKTLLRRTLEENHFPELSGWENLYSSLEVKQTSELIDESVIHLVSTSNGKRILDYGCGDGRISRKLRDKGYTMTAFDTDPSGFLKRSDNIGIELLETIAEEGRKFDTAICSIVLCTISEESEVREVLSNIHMLLKKDGECVISICNPLSISVRNTCNRINPVSPGRYDGEFDFTKIVLSTNHQRKEHHRPLRTYINLFNRSGFEVIEINESEGTDRDNMLPSSDFMFFRLRSTDPVKEYDVSLMIKASAMEWETIEWQVSHIVTSLEKSVRFREKIVITDTEQNEFSRQYARGDYKRLEISLKRLKESGIIDRYIIAPDEEKEISSISKRWFGLETKSRKSLSSQPIITTLFGFEQCSGDYILQLDSDIIIGYRGSPYDYLNNIIDLMEHDERILTVSLPIAGSELSEPVFYENALDPFRIEVRCCIINRKLLLENRPYKNEVDGDGKLISTWHRSADLKIRDKALKSYRSKGNIFFIHVPNDRKRDINKWYNIVRSVESGNINDKQAGNVDLTGNMEDWIGQRREKIQIITRGRNVPVSKIRRCINSISSQNIQNFGLTFIDANSDNETSDYLNYILKPKLKDRLTVYQNVKTVRASENTYNVIKHITTDNESIIIQVDADDELVNPDAVKLISSHYDTGADLTSGSMIRTDKSRRYFIDFNHPEENRGGNIWAHPRTFMRRLFIEIGEEALKLDGEWLEYAEDWGYMLPISGKALKPEFIEDILYLYDPSVEKKERSRELRESMIGKIVSNYIKKRTT